MPMPRKSKEEGKKKKIKATSQGNVREGKKIIIIMCTCKWAFLSIKKKFIPTKFSLYFEEKTFWWAKGENTWVLSFIFLPPHPTKYTPKNILFLFSLQNFPFTLFHLQTNTP